MASHTSTKTTMWIIGKPEEEDDPFALNGSGEVCHILEAGEAIGNLLDGCNCSSEIV